MTLRTLGLEALTIRDERSLRHVGLYESLKAMLLRDGARFRVPPVGSPQAFWDRVLFLNLTFWNAADPSDVLVDEGIDADVVCHVAWHHAARKGLQREGVGAPTADALFLGESIASAFDLYLVGRTLGRESAFNESQVPAMVDAASECGLSDEETEAMLLAVAEEPERAFEDLRSLLFDAATTLVGCEGVDAAYSALEGLSSRRFAPLLHHFELSNWVLYARAYAAGDRGPDPRVRAIDRALREAPVSLDWLAERWLGEP